MNDERLRRRRRRRRGQRPALESITAAEDTQIAPVRDAPAQVHMQRPSLPAWQWMTLPVGVAFCAGIVVMGLVTNGPVAGLIVFFAGVFGLAFAAAHILVRLWLTRRR